MKRIYTHTDRFQGEKFHLFDTCYSYTQNHIADIYTYIKHWSTHIDKFHGEKSEHSEIIHTDHSVLFTHKKK